MSPITLAEVGFDKEKYRLFAYNDIPGRDSAVEARSFGNAWNSTIWGGDYRNFRYLQMDNAEGCDMFIFCPQGTYLKALDNVLQKDGFPWLSLKSKVSKQLIFTIIETNSN